MRISLIIVAFFIASCSSKERSELADKMSSMNSPSSKIHDSSVHKDFPKQIGAINFEFDSTDIQEHSKYLLDKVVEEVKKSPVEVLVYIQGHTDRLGPKDYNKLLGLERAISVKAELKKKGIPEKRIRTVSLGENRPLILTNNWKDREYNRRVTIELVPLNPRSTFQKVSQK